ncbi:helix-turn-helix domain-containing protein, partial [Hydrogenimonas sp.]
AMRFSDYLKACRERLGLTQEELVTELYLFDDARFEGITPTTMSRWERGATMPPMPRMADIVAYFQTRFGRPLPCVEARDAEEVEALMCEEPIGGLFKPKRMVAGLSLAHDEGEPFSLVNLRHHPRAEELLELNAMLHRSVNTPYTRVDTARFKRWIDHPGNMFAAVTYRTSFLGLLFTLRVKPESFDALLRFEKRKDDLAKEDFAAPNEEGSVYMLSFFAISQEIATMLFRRFYAHLIANQERTKEAGFVSSFEEAQELAHRLNLRTTGRKNHEGTEILAFRTDLFALMTSSMALKALFPKRHCT